MEKSSTITIDYLKSITPAKTRDEIILAVAISTVQQHKIIQKVIKSQIVFQYTRRTDIFQFWINLDKIYLKSPSHYFFQVASNFYSKVFILVVGCKMFIFASLFSFNLFMCSLHFISLSQSFVFRVLIHVAYILFYFLCNKIFSVIVYLLHSIYYLLFFFLL